MPRHTRWCLFHATPPPPPPLPLMLRVPPSLVRRWGRRDAKGRSGAATGGADAARGIRIDLPPPLLSAALLMHATLPSVQVGKGRTQGAQRSSKWGGGGEMPRGAAEQQLGEQRRQGDGAKGREGKEGTERREGREDESEGRQGGEEEREGVELLCVVRALLKKLRRRVLVGDVVRLGGIDWAARQAVVQDVALPRASEILDPPVANADHLLLLFSLAQPPPEPTNVSRFLVAAEATGVAVSLVFNKADLVDEQVRLAVSPSSVPSLPFLHSPPFLLSHLPSPPSLPPGNKEQQRGGSAVVAAAGGRVGVSDAHVHCFLQPSLANVSASALPMLFPEPSLCPSFTLSHTNLSPIPLLPPFSPVPSFSLARLSPLPSPLSSPSSSSLSPNVSIRSRLAASPTSCAFADCRHISEPGCAVDSGWERYRHYVMLMDEIRAREAAEIRAVGTKREGDVRLKSGGYGVVVAEPRLEAKKHRRESRKKGKQLLLQQLAVEEEEDEEEGVGFAGGYGGSEKRRK
ncbi:unnamed protein product [Closterium sp. Naga37s-1]|nr:unnamed protein product [Closterium sp. Naga37s-1]